MLSGKPFNSSPINRVALCLNAQDDVAIAKIDLSAGSEFLLEEDQAGETLTLISDIPAGHKLALRKISPGGEVRRYGQVIGFAIRDIEPGQHVHVHNLGLHDFDRLAESGIDALQVGVLPMSERRTFSGYLRTNGSVGTRNMIAVISTVNCSAHVCREIAKFFTPSIMGDYPNVNGVIAITHTLGCSSRLRSPDHKMLQRTLGGFASHPNVGASILVGLGCETNQVSSLIEDCGLCSEFSSAVDCDHVLEIQALGGVHKTIETGIQAVEALLPIVNQTNRTIQPVSELKVALQCGGSDAWSGVTANPVVGLVSDELVRQGGTVVLGETTEIFGAEHLLVRRSASPDITNRLLEMVTWWRDYTRIMGMDIDDNRSVGNQAGGLTTIFEKSLGAIAKAGSSPLNGVYDYAEQVNERGFTFMNTPGNDPISVTGQVAGGCNLVLFTTGRGSVFGYKPAPSIKISATTGLFQRMPADIDLDAGVCLDGTPMDQVASELFELMIEVASGQPSKSETQGIGEAEFVPWSFAGSL